MRYISLRALIVLTAVSGAFLTLALTTDGTPQFWIFMVWLVVVFFCLGGVFGNFNAIAMEPIGHMAGPWGSRGGLCFNLYCATHRLVFRIIV